MSAMTTSASLATDYRPPGYHPLAIAVLSLVGVVAMVIAARFTARLPYSFWVLTALGGVAVGVAAIAYLLGPDLSIFPGFALVCLGAAMFAFFPRRTAVLYVVVSSSAYGAVLAFQRGNAEPFGKWLTVVGATVIVGTITGYLVDRTRALAVAERQARTEAEEAKAALEVVNRHKSEFLASMSHELRTPLNAVIGFGEVLDQGLFGELNPKQAEYMGDIVSSGHHLLSLINDVLDLSKVEAGRMELEVAEVSVPELLTSSLGLFREQAARHRIELGLRLDSQVGELCCDERKVRQVTFNLLSNAVKFTPEGGRVELAATRRNGSVEIAVSDTGPGIDFEDQERIFEEFAQARTSNNGRGPSTGLGLALARRFVELHGGTIAVESTPGHGATFRFSLPVGDAV